MSRPANGWSWRENPYTNATEGHLFVDGFVRGNVTGGIDGFWRATPWNPPGPAVDFYDSREQAVKHVEDAVGLAS